MRKITLLKGDGIGPEISQEVVRIIDSLDLPIEFEVYEVGQKAFDKCGKLIPDEVMESIKRNKIALKAPITTPIATGFRSVNVSLRLAFNLYANIRPAITLPNVYSRYENIDIVVFRENTEDLYIGEEKVIDDNTVEAIKRITRSASTKIIRAAFEYAQSHQRKTVTCVHKANILKLSDGMFLNIFNEISKEYPNINANNLIVDNACMQLVMNPEKLDVMVMPNLYGDILSDLVSGLIGGLGFLPSANKGDEYAIYEAVHGSAPDIANQNIANPTALLLSACLMLDDLNYSGQANLIREAINHNLINNIKTRDCGGNATTTQFAQGIIDYIKK